MARPVTTLVVFFFAMQLFAGLLMGMGVDDTLGINAEIEDESATEEFESNFDDEDGVSLGSGLGESLEAFYNSLANFAGGIYEYLMPGLVMLERAGVPDDITKMLARLFSLLTAIAIAAYARGYEL